VQLQIVLDGVLQESGVDTCPAPASMCGRRRWDALLQASGISKTPMAITQYMRVAQ
jgi:hypothetical protein